MSETDLVKHKQTEEYTYQDYNYNEELDRINLEILREYFEIFKLRLKKQMYSYLVWREESDAPQESFAAIYVTIFLKTIKLEIELLLNWLVNRIKVT